MSNQLQQQMGPYLALQKHYGMTQQMQPMNQYLQYPQAGMMPGGYVNQQLPMQTMSYPAGNMGLQQPVGQLTQQPVNHMGMGMWQGAVPQGIAPTSALNPLLPSQSLSSSNLHNVINQPVTGAQGQNPPSTAQQPLLPQSTAHVPSSAQPSAQPAPTMITQTTPAVNPTVPQEQQSQPPYQS